MEPASALRAALELLVGITQPIDVPEDDPSKWDLARILEEPGITAAIAQEAGYGTPKQPRPSRQARRSFMRSLQRYRGRGAQKRRPSKEVERAIRRLGLNVVRRRRRLGSVGQIVELIAERGATVLAGAELTILIISGTRQDERERSNLPAVFVPPAELARQGWREAARRAVASGDWADAAQRFFAAWVNSYGIGAAAYVTDVESFELRVGRYGAPRYGSSAA